MHHLYVLVTKGDSPADKKSRALTLAILNYVHKRHPLLASMGVALKVHGIANSDLRNPRLIKAMKQKKISSLPALVTPSNTYVGNRSIGEVYETNIAKYKKFQRRPGGGGKSVEESDSDMIDEYYRKEMAQPTDTGNSDEESVIGGEGDDMMQALSSMGDRRAEHPPSGGRPANVAHGPEDEDADRFEATGTQDDLMERAYWSKEPMM
mgnify:CR=1 FL=1